MGTKVCCCISGLRKILEKSFIIMTSLCDVWWGSNLICIASTLPKVHVRKAPFERHPLSQKRLFTSAFSRTESLQQWWIWGRGPGGLPPLFWVKKEELTEGKMAGRASKSRPPPPTPLAQGLDPPLYSVQ